VSAIDCQVVVARIHTSRLESRRAFHTQLVAAHACVNVCNGDANSVRWARLGAIGALVHLTAWVWGRRGVAAAFDHQQAAHVVPVVTDEVAFELPASWADRRSHWRPGFSVPFDQHDSWTLTGDLVREVYDLPFNGLDHCGRGPG
jgi:hypothetical protein